MFAAISSDREAALIGLLVSRRRIVDVEQVIDPVVDRRVIDPVVDQPSA